MNKLTKFSRAIFAIAIVLCFLSPFETSAQFNVTNVDTTNMTCWISRATKKIVGDYVIPKASRITGYNGTFTIVGIKGSAFKEQDSITSLTIPATIAEIGDNAFASCTRLNYLKFDDSENSLELGNKEIFSGCPIKTVYIGRTLSINAFFADNTDIKEVVIGEKITKIKPFAYSGCSNLSSIYIPNTVTSIGSDAFSNCKSLTSITIPNSVTSIGDYAFEYCTSLKNVIIADGNTSITLGHGRDLMVETTSMYNYQGLFKDCPIEKLYIGRDISYQYSASSPLYKQAPFQANSTLTELEIGNSVTTIGQYLFQFCENLSSVKMGSSVESIEEGAFNGCCSLYEIIIPDSLTTIKARTFESCTSLNKIVIPNSVTTIERYAFKGCTNLTEVEIGINVTNIMGYDGYEGVSAFSGCNNIKKIIWNAKNCTTYVNSYQRGCQEPFGSSASMVEEVIFGDNVRNIGQNLCNGFSKVTELTFPATLVSVGTDAFSGCSSIQSVTSKNPYPTDISEISRIPSASPAAMLYVPQNSAVLYKEKTGWKSFANIIELENPKIYLTLKFPESGTITHKEFFEEAVDLSFKANEGWEINSVTFNNEDVTAELDEDGNYTTPILTADAILVVVFEKIDTSVEPISEKNNIKIYAYNGEVRIVGAEPQSEVSIYNSIGALVYKGNDKTIALDGNGVYILTVEGRTFKFAI